MLKMLAKLRKPVKVSYYKGYWENGNAAMTDEVELPVGTIVKVVMCSRFGDVGITEDLSRDSGYGARVNPEILEFKVSDMTQLKFERRGLARMVRM